MGCCGKFDKVSLRQQPGLWIVEHKEPAPLSVRKNLILEAITFTSTLAIENCDDLFVRYLMPK